MSTIYNKIIKKGAAFSLLAGSLFMAKQGAAQHLNPFGASYFQNQYLANPALAGSQAGFLGNVGYRKESSDIPNSPNNEYLTAEYGFDKVGVGLNVFNDKAGVLRSTRVVGTYAYHIELTPKQHLSIGLSAGVWNQRIDESAVNGEIDDASLGSFNNRKMKFDADFGVAYSYGGLTVQGAFPNLVTYFRKEEDEIIDRSTFFAAASYKLRFGSDESTIRLEPKVAYRGVKGYDNIVDVGAHVSFMDDLFSFFTMYHTSKSATFGAGLTIKKQIGVMVAYTTNTSELKQYSSGDFELGVRFSLGKSK